MIAFSEDASEVRRVVETVEERDLGDRAASLGGIAHGAGALFESAAEDVSADSFTVSFEKLMEAPW